MYWKLRDIRYALASNSFNGGSFTKEVLKRAVIKTIKTQYGFSQDEADFIAFHYNCMIHSNLDYVDKIEDFCELYAKLKTITSEEEAYGKSTQL